MGRDHKAAAARSWRNRPLRPLLTDNEWGIIDRWANGLTVNGMSRNDSHRNTLYQQQKTLLAKLRAKTATQAMFMAVRYGLIEPELYELDNDPDPAWVRARLMEKE